MRVVTHQTAQQYQLNSHRYQPKTAANVLRHLPLHRNLSASQAALVAITPAWQSWLNNAIKQKNVVRNAEQSIRLEAITHDRNNHSNQLYKTDQKPSDSVVSGTLVVSCDNPIVATQLKHLRESIIEHLNAHSPLRAQDRVIINAVVIRVRPESGPNPNQPSTQSTGGKTHSVLPSESSLRAIEIAIETATKQAAKPSTANNDLAGALQRLATTLRGLGKG